MAAAHSWTCLMLVWIIADTTGKTPGNTPFTTRLASVGQQCSFSRTFFIRIPGLIEQFIVSDTP